jgi:hypothetical protein
MLITRSRKELFASSLGYCKKILTVDRAIEALTSATKSSKKYFFKDAKFRRLSEVETSRILPIFYKSQPCSTGQNLLSLVN